MGFFSDVGNSKLRRGVVKYTNAADGPQTLHRIAIAGGIKRAPADSRTCVIVCSDGTKDAAGDIVDVHKIQLDRFKRNPVILWQHRQDMPVAMAKSIGVQGGQLIAEIEFPPPGTSSASDEARQLVKSGIVSGVSIGFAPLEQPEPLGDGGVRFGLIELLECSLVSVPSNPSALVVTRSAQELQAPSAAAWCAAKRAELEDAAARRHYDNPHKPRVEFRPTPIVERDWSSLPAKAPTPTPKSVAPTTERRFYSAAELLHQERERMRRVAKALQVIARNGL